MSNPDSKGYNGDGIPIGPSCHPRDLTGYVKKPFRSVDTKKKRNENNGGDYNLGLDTEFIGKHDQSSRTSLVCPSGSLNGTNVKGLFSLSSPTSSLSSPSSISALSLNYPFSPISPLLPGAHFFDPGQSSGPYTVSTHQQNTTIDGALPSPITSHTERESLNLPPFEICKKRQLTQNHHIDDETEKGSCVLVNHCLTLLDHQNLHWFTTNFDPSESLLHLNISRKFSLNSSPEYSNSDRPECFDSYNSESTVPDMLDWICFCNSNERKVKLEPIESVTQIKTGIERICSIPKNIKMIRKKEYDAMLERLLELAIEMNHISGKWVLTPSSEEVNELWKLVGKAIYAGKLGAVAKVSVGKNRKERAGHAGPIVCIYVDDFRDRETVRKIVHTLLEDQFKAYYIKFPFFKPDFLTTKFGFHSGNMEYRRNVIAAQLELQYGISREWLEMSVESSDKSGNCASRLEILSKMTTRSRIGVMHEDIVQEESERDKQLRQSMSIEDQKHNADNRQSNKPTQQQKQLILQQNQPLQPLYITSTQNMSMLQSLHENLGFIPQISGYPRISVSKKCPSTMDGGKREPPLPAAMLYPPPPPPPPRLDSRCPNKTISRNA